MNTPVRNIMRRLSGREKFNILSFAYNGFFEYDLAKTGHNIYCPMRSGHKIVKPAPLDNLFFVQEDMGQLPLHTDFDLVLVNDKIAQYALGRKIADSFHIPLMVTEHYFALPNIRPQDMMMLSQNKYDGRIEVLEGISSSWKLPACPTIRYGIEPIEIQNNDRKQVLLYGNFSAPDYNILTLLQQTIPNLKICGDSPGFASQPVTREELIEEIKKSAVYINLSKDTSITHPMLYAMAAQCVIVTNKVENVPSLIQAGVNGEHVEDIANIQKYISTALAKKEHAIKTNLDIIKDFSMPKFVAQWKAIFDSTKGFTYT